MRARLGTLFRTRQGTESSPPASFAWGVRAIGGMEVARVEYVSALVALLGVLVDLVAVAAIGLLVVVALRAVLTDQGTHPAERERERSPTGGHRPRAASQRRWR